MAEAFLGEIRMFAGNFAPRGWALCQGQLIPIQQNTALFALLGTYYGGNGTQNFALPDLRGRVSVGQGQGPGLSPYVIGEVYGVENVSLLSNEIASHSHSAQATTGAAVPASGPSGALAATGANAIYGTGAPSVNMAAQAVGSTGGVAAHNNMAPTLALNFIIALQGVFPSRN